MIYKDRRIEAYIAEEFQSAIVIDVLQKQGDCSGKFAPDGKLKCPGDCRNRYVNFVYSIEGKAIIMEGALLREGIEHFILQKMPKNITSIREFVETQNRDIDEIRTDDDLFSVLYAGSVKKNKEECCFIGAYNVETSDAEVSDYQNYIRENIVKIMAQCGVKFSGSGYIINFDSPDNIRSIFQGLRSKGTC